MPYTIQCQNPEPVGASGSKQVTAKPFVSAGKPDQRRCGDRFSPVAPNPLNTCLLVNCSPSATSSLSTVNDGTGGMNSYGSGGCSVMVSSKADQDLRGPHPRYSAAGASGTRPLGCVAPGKDHATAARPGRRGARMGAGLQTGVAGGWRAGNTDMTGRKGSPQA